MLNTRLEITALALILLHPWSQLLLCSAAQAPKLPGADGAIACTVMEVFEDGKLGVRAIIFHQRDKANGPQLGALLLADSGKAMELETTRGQRYLASVFRVRSCFGRGLAIIPAGNPTLHERDAFILHPPRGN